MTKKEETKQLVVVVPRGLHNRLKLMSINHNCTITAVVMRALLEALAKEEAAQ